MKSFLFLCAFAVLVGCSEDFAEKRARTSAEERAAEISPPDGYGLPLDEWSRPQLPPSMIRLSHRDGHRLDMKNYEKYHIVHDVSTNVFVATPAWAPSSGQPVPLAIHEAYAIYLDWQKTQPENKRWNKNHDTIELTSERLLVVHDERYREVARRWFYKINFNFGLLAPENEVYILLDGTLVVPWVIDLRNDDEKKEDEEQWRTRRRFY